MKTTTLIFALFCCALISCQNENTAPDISAIDLYRGELTLCSPEQFGEVQFSLECEYDSREAFDLAISLLHSFEYREAEKVFVSVIDMDPECAMAYWGVAMSNYHALWSPANESILNKGAAILKSAEDLKKTEREQEYFDAIEAYYSDWDRLDENERTLRFEAKMEAIYLKHPEDKEAAIFYALALKAAADPNDKTYRRQIKAGGILESLFPDQPNHPGIAHYIIHNYDHPELAERALSTARVYAEIAPSSAHAQHMPSHIFTRLGLWDESIASNINSTESSVCYSETSGINAHLSEEVHGMDYLVYAYLQKGDNENAKAQLIYLESFENVYPQNFASSYATAAIPARIALENRDWETAANLEVPDVKLDWNNYPWQNSIIHFTRALGSVHLNDLDKAESEVAILEQNHVELTESNKSYEADQVMIQLKMAEAWIAYAKGDSKMAIKGMQEAVAMESLTGKHPVTPGEVLPASELLGDLYLTLNKPEEALEAYTLDLKGHPNRLNGLYGCAMASLQMGNIEEAKSYFEALTLLSKDVESDRKEIKEAEVFLLTFQA